MRAPGPLAPGTKIAFWSAPSDRADRPVETVLRQSFDRMRLSERQHIGAESAICWHPEGMKLGAEEAGREARLDKRWGAWRLARAGACRYLLKDLHSRELIRAIETPRTTSP